MVRMELPTAIRARSGLESLFGHQKPAVGTEIVDDVLERGDFLLRNRPVPELAPGDPEHVDASNRDPGGHANLMDHAVGCGEWVVHFGGEPEFTEQASRAVLILLPWFSRRAILPGGPVRGGHRRPAVMSGAARKGLTKARAGSGLKLRGLPDQPRAWNGSISCPARSSRTGPAGSSCSTGTGRPSRPVPPTASLREGNLAQPARMSQIVSTTPRLTP